MPERKRKKKNKLRGNRTHGKGNTKNRRGAGCRGGRGRAGSHKHKFSKYYAEFGKHGFVRKNKKKTKAINIGDLTIILERLSKEGKAKKTETGYEIDFSLLGYDKLLGAGEVKEKLLLRNASATKKAREKIEASGGKIE